MNAHTHTTRHQLLTAVIAEIAASIDEMEDAPGGVQTVGAATSNQAGDGFR